VAVGAASLGYLDQAHEALHLAGVIYGVGPLAIIAGNFQGSFIYLDANNVRQVEQVSAVLDGNELGHGSVLGVSGSIPSIYPLHIKLSTPL
jgi:hypothetical protein